MYNKVILVGNLTRDPELRYTAQGTQVCTIGLAVNNRRSKNEEVLFIDVTCWGQQAEHVSTYMAKGRQVLIEGRLTYRKWEGQDGSMRSKHEIVADTVQFLGQRENGAADDKPQKPDHAAAAAGDKEQKQGSGSGLSHDDDIPF